MSNQVSRGVELEIKKISKEFIVHGESSKILSDISFKVGAGEIVGICGLSGVGKSTLLRIIAGLAESTSGEILRSRNGEGTTSLRLGFVTQDYSRSLFPWLTVSRNIALAFKSTSIPRAEQRSMTEAMLKVVGLENAAKLFPWQLSGGMQQRVAIARALVNNPELLLLDEPFASVDAHVRLELEDLIAKLVKDFGVTTILVTHDIDEAIYLADRVLTLIGTPAGIGSELIIDFPRPRTQTSTRALPEFSKLRNELYTGLRIQAVD